MEQELMHKKPKLSIKTNDPIVLDPSSEFSQQIYEQTNSYSITPTTFQSRTFFAAGTDFDIKKIVKYERKNVGDSITKVESDIKKFKNYQGNLISLLEQITCAVQDSETPNIAKDILDKLTTNINLEPLKSYLAELEKFQEFLSKIELLTFEDLYKYGDDEVSRFGINTANMNPKQSIDLASIYTPAIAKQASEKSKKSSTSSKKSEAVKTLTPLEVCLLRKAIEHLKTNQTVLVDIFDKNDNGSIKLDEEQKLKIHTVVLYRNPADESQVFVIDPSNSTFSKHLSVNSLRLFGAIIPDIKIKTSSTELKIYSPPEGASVGPEPYQYRDCIDIAVKIAFGLNHESITDIRYITSSRVVSSITNQRDITENLFFRPEDVVARIRQASDPNIREHTHKLLIAAAKQINAFKQFCPLEYVANTIISNFIEAFSVLCTPDEYITKGINELHTTCQTNTDLLKEQIDISSQSLLGITITHEVG